MVARKRTKGTRVIKKPKRIRVKRRVPVKRRTKMPVAGIKRARIEARKARRAKARRVAGSEMNWSKFKSGRAKKPGLGLLLKTGLKKVIDRFQNIGPIDKAVADNGANTLVYAQCNSSAIGADMAYGAGMPLAFAVNPSTLGSTEAAGYMRMPFHLIHLTAHPDFDPVSDAYMYQCFTDSSSGQPTFTRMYGTSNVGQATATPQVEWSANGPDTANLIRSERFINFQWFDIKLMLRNAKAQQTYYDIWIMGFKDSHLDPLEYVGSTKELADRRAFWNEMGARGIGHPISQQDATLNKVMRRVRIYKRYRVVMKAEQTTEEDASASNRIVEIFHRDGRTLDFAWASAPQYQVMDSARLAVVAPWQFKAQAELADNVDIDFKPKATQRLWLMISAYDPSWASKNGLLGSGAYETWNDIVARPDVNPQYDFIIRRKTVTCSQGMQD